MRRSRVQYATPIIDKDPPPDLSDVSGKIRRLLEEHLDVTGLRTLVKLRSLTDPEFWDDFATEEEAAKEIRRATIREATELERITLVPLPRSRGPAMKGPHEEHPGGRTSSARCRQLGEDRST